MPAQSVGIIYKHSHEPARLEAEKLEGWLKEREIEVFSEEMEAEESFDMSSQEASVIPKTVNWVVVLGGDGTMLGDMDFQFWE